jgi:guanine nucleotide-binding protein alpha-1 subunit
MLWKDICSNKLLANAVIILFFNKVRLGFLSPLAILLIQNQKDVLSATLAAGVSVRKYVPSYSDANEISAVTKCK